MHNLAGTRSRSYNSRLSVKLILVQFVLCSLSFYLGFMSMFHLCEQQQSCKQYSNYMDNPAPTLSVQDDDDDNNNQIEEEITKRVNELVEKRLEEEVTKTMNELARLNSNSITDTPLESNIDGNKSPNDDNTSFSKINLFPKNSIFMGAANLPRDEFLKQFDFGTPADPTTSDQVILLYQNKNSLPTLQDGKLKEILHDSLTSYSTQHSNSLDDIKSTSKDKDIISHLHDDKDDSAISYLSDITLATNKCESLQIVTIDGGRKSCIALLQNYQNSHVQNWIKQNTNQPFFVYRGRYENDKKSGYFPPETKQIQEHWKLLLTYFQHVDDTMAQLKQITSKIAVDNTIVVMTCNFGQSELLMNFVCNAKAKGLDIKNVLIFPTDLETKELAESLGLATFHDDKNFSNLPKKAAGAYGDGTFGAMMFAKVVCVQLIAFLGYDLLFQDVDVVWYKNPIEYFKSKTIPYPGFDMYFQDDGARSARFSPFSANSGFYYVKSNAKTNYFFTSLLYHSDMILRSKSHQQDMIQLLAEHSSLYGLKIKVLPREEPSFPSGWFYHRRKDLMKQIAKGEIIPYIFHMCWTTNKDNKLKFFQQMGEWYLHQSCISKNKNDIMRTFGLSQSDVALSSVSSPLLNSCCLVEPDIKCHYRDKPSKIPCTKSPPIDKGGKSFW